jgi:uncharacterized protein YuzE
MCQNDAHLFVRPDQIREEFSAVVNLILEVYKDFGFKDYRFRLSLRDKENKEKYIDNDEMWESAESQLRDTLNALGLDYYEAKGEAAFYGCESIKSLSIGENLNQIGDYAFGNSTKLKSVTINAKQVPSYNYFTDLFGTYIAYLNVPCEALKAYELDNAFGQFKYIRCIEEEEEAPEDVEIEVDDNGNVNIKWPPTEGANSYKLVVSHAGNVICTLQFNSKGQLTSIDLGKRSASVGFEFTVTGLSQGSKYSYEMTALSEVNEVLDYYAGAFITNGYKEDDDVTTSINESITDANITVSGGTISADADFSIYNTIGLDVTAFNGCLQPGVYVVALGEDRVKIMIK